MIFQSSYLIHNKYTGLDNYPNLLHLTHRKSPGLLNYLNLI